MYLVRELLAVAVMVTGFVAADAPYAGKWKLDPAKSQLTGDTVTIKKLPDGMLQFDSQGFVYNFRPDGKDYPTPIGGTVSWKGAGPDTWDVTNRLKDKVVSTVHIVLKGDRQALTIKVMKPDGGTVDSTASYNRVSGGPGIEGVWRSSEFKPQATVLQISSDGADSVALKDESGFAVNGKFDGKDHPASGTLAGASYAFSFRKVGERAFEMTAKLDGKPYYQDVFTVSADGKTLTDEGTPLNAKAETVKAVYDRQ
ncbi:MAG: hypothetical protein ABI652_05650 [Acidobacteriota bacterium]